MAKVKFDGIEPNIDPPKGTKTKVRKPETQANASAPGRVRIVLEENEDIPPTGQFIGLNGIGYILRPGVPVDVPLGVKEILDNAVLDVPQVNPDTLEVIGTRPKMRYPYRLA